jgi:hypothetical protein
LLPSILIINPANAGTINLKCQLTGGASILQYQIDEKLKFVKEYSKNRGGYGTSSVQKQRLVFSSPDVIVWEWDNQFDGNSFYHRNELDRKTNKLTTVYRATYKNGNYDEDVNEGRCW